MGRYPINNSRGVNMVAMLLLGLTILSIKLYIVVLLVNEWLKFLKSVENTKNEEN